MQPVAGWGFCNIMPSEVRIIAFTPEDVLEAIEGSNAAADERRFSGKVLDCRVRKQPGVHAILAVRRADGEEIDTVDLNSVELTAALISFCYDRRIPLHRRSSGTDRSARRFRI